MRAILVFVILVTGVVSVFAFREIFTGEGGDPRSGLADSIYAALQLFTLSLDRPPANQELPLVRQVGRFVAPILTAGAVWVAAASFARSWIDRRSVRRWSGHHVVCGDSSNAHAIAAALAGSAGDVPGWRKARHVVFVTHELPLSTVEPVRAVGVRAVKAAPGAPTFRSALMGAQSITIAYGRGRQVPF